MVVDLAKVRETSQHVLPGNFVTVVKSDTTPIDINGRYARGFYVTGAGTLSLYNSDGDAVSFGTVAVGLCITGIVIVGYAESSTATVVFL